MIEDALKWKFNNTAEITALVADRVFPEIAPTNTKCPRIVYTKPDDKPEQCMAGASGLASCTFQLDVYSNVSSKEASEVAEAIRLKLDGVNVETWDGVQIRNVVLKSGPSAFTEPVSDSEEGLFRVMAEYKVWYYHTVPTP